MKTEILITLSTVFFVILLCAGCVKKAPTLNVSERSTTQPTGPTASTTNLSLGEISSNQPANPDIGLPDDEGAPIEEIPEGDASTDVGNITKGLRNINTSRSNLSADLSEITAKAPLNPDYGSDAVAESTGDFGS